MSKIKPKIKTVRARVMESIEYYASFKCPHCNVDDTEDYIEEDDITIDKTCYKCKKKYKVKIPKDSLY